MAQATGPRSPPALGFQMRLNSAAQGGLEIYFLFFFLLKNINFSLKIIDNAHLQLSWGFASGLISHSAKQHDRDDNNTQKKDWKEMLVFVDIWTTGDIFLLTSLSAIFKDACAFLVFPEK